MESMNEMMQRQQREREKLDSDARTNAYAVHHERRQQRWPRSTGAMFRSLTTASPRWNPKRNCRRSPPLELACGSMTTEKFS